MASDGGESEGLGDDARRSARAGVVLQLEYRSASHLLVSYCTNLSRGGLFVPSTDPLPAGTRVALTLSIPGEDESFDLFAEVRWVRQFDASEGPAGMGLAFDGIDRVLGDRIDEIVAQFVPLQIELVGSNAQLLGSAAAMIRPLVSCETFARAIDQTAETIAELARADLVVVEIGSDAAPALELLRRLAAQPHPPPRLALCDGRNPAWPRVVPLARIVQTPVDPTDLRTCVLESVAQVEGRRR
jgi:uncharacterized protein (TIGR02266 family)